MVENIHGATSNSDANPSANSVGGSVRTRREGGDSREAKADGEQGEDEEEGGELGGEAPPHLPPPPHHHHQPHHPQNHN